MASYEQKTSLKPVKALNITAITSSTTTVGSSIDTKGFESLTLFVELGARTDGTFLPLIQDSDDDINFANVDDQFLIGTEAEAQINTANTIKTIGYVGKKRYVKLSIVSTAVTSGGATVSATGILANANVKPV
jgi:hypothetical protein